jgi:hypothetical protein
VVGIGVDAEGVILDFGVLLLLDDIGALGKGDVVGSVWVAL